MAHFHLIVNSDTGAKNAIRLTVTEASGDAGLAQFDTTSNNQANRWSQQQMLQLI